MKVFKDRQTWTPGANSRGESFIRGNIGQGTGTVTETFMAGRLDIFFPVSQMRELMRLF
jgi:hypothetical protein